MKKIRDTLTQTWVVSGQSEKDQNHRLGSKLNILDNSNLVSDIQSIIIRSQSDIGLLIPGWSDQCVHFGHIDVVQLLDGSLDLVLVGLDVTDEDQGVVVLDLLHGGLGGQRVLDDGVGVHLVPLGDGLTGVLGVPKNKKIFLEKNVHSCGQLFITWES